MLGVWFFTVFGPLTIFSHAGYRMETIADYQRKVLNKLNDEGKIDLDLLIEHVLHESKDLDELTYDEAALLIIEVGILLK